MYPVVRVHRCGGDCAAQAFDQLANELQPTAEYVMDSWQRARRGSFSA
jgi:hypothetical protein